MPQRLHQPVARIVTSDVHSENVGNLEPDSRYKKIDVISSAWRFLVASLSVEA